MITIRSLKERLDKFPDTHVVTVLEDDESSMIGIYKYASETPNQAALTMIPEPVGYISTLGGLTVVFDPDNPNDQDGKELVIE